MNFPSRRIPSLILLLSLLLNLSLLTSCVPDEEFTPNAYLLPGETVTKTISYCFYIGENAPSAENQATIPLLDVDYTVLVADPEWELPDGIEITHSDITLAPKDIIWEVADGSITAHGAKITITYEISARTAASQNEGDIFVKFPNLNQLKGNFLFFIQQGYANTCSGTPKPNENLDMWKLHHVQVFSDADEKAAAVKGQDRFYSGSRIISIIAFSIAIGVIIWVKKMKWTPKIAAE